MELNTKLRRLLVLPPIILGIALIAWMATNRAGPERLRLAEHSRVVRVIPALKAEVVPRALGYGYVQPNRVWQAVAQVSGKIIEKHPLLKQGAIVAEGDVLLRIDPTDYKLAVQRIGGEIRGARAALAELEVEQTNIKSSLAIDVGALDLAVREVERKRTLRKGGTISQTALDSEERNVLERRQAVQQQTNALNLIPARRETLEAKLATLAAQLAEAQENIIRTVISAPFDSRIAEVNVENTQFAAAGEVLAVADSIDIAEISAQIPVDKLLPLIPANLGSELEFSPANVIRLVERIGFEATVRLTAGDITYEWPGRFTRIRETVDPVIRTVGVVVAVDAPYRSARLGERPPLAKNMYVAVELIGRLQPSAIVIPRSAVHDGLVFVVNDDSRLERRAVTLGIRQTDFVTILSGLEENETIVVSDLSPAVEGMLLRTVEASDILTLLKAQASGASSIK